MADTKEILICPACGKEMKKVFVDSANINVDICTEGCGGILFDNRELEKFDESHEKADEIFANLDGKKFVQVDDSKKRICPVCDTPMVKMGANGGIQIDVCNVCGAKFLDNGELNSIRNTITNDSNFKAKFDVQYAEKEKENNEDLVGPISGFLKKYWTKSKGSEISEKYVKQFLGDRKNDL